MSATMLSFGVTGHRKLASDDPRLAAQVANAMREALQDLSGPTAESGIVVSSLAEGADRLVARVGLDQFGFRLVVPLPMPADDYETDFESTESRREFHGLLARAAAIVEAPLLSTDFAWKHAGHARNQQYAWGGAYLVSACDVLVALWDGAPARGVGGTANVVEWFLAGELPSVYGLVPRHGSAGQPGATRRLIHIVPATGAVRIQNVIR